MVPISPAAQVHKVLCFVEISGCQTNKSVMNVYSVIRFVTAERDIMKHQRRFSVFFNYGSRTHPSVHTLPDGQQLVCVNEMASALLSFAL